MRETPDGGKGGAGRGCVRRRVAVRESREREKKEGEGDVYLLKRERESGGRWETPVDDDRRGTAKRESGRGERREKVSRVRERARG